MNEQTFWEIIESANRGAEGDCFEQADLVQSALVDLPAAEIQAFDTIFREKLRAAYTEDLWGAAYLMNGGCSDDGFEYFRSWLIGNGRAIFEDAVAQPDSLAEVVGPDDGDHECEDLLYVAMKSFEQVSGKPLPPPTIRSPREPAGESWDFDDAEESARRLPRLSKRFA